MQTFSDVPINPRISLSTEISSFPEYLPSISLGDVHLSTDCVDELSLLCEEFENESLQSHLVRSLDQAQSDFYADSQARNSIADLASRLLTHERVFASLQRALAPLSDRANEFGELRKGLVKAHATFPAELQRIRAVIEELRDVTANLKNEIFGISNTMQSQFEGLTQTQQTSA
jgi:hypothetical protein